MKTLIVTITKVGPGWVDYESEDGNFSISNKHFPNARVGQKWKVTTYHSGQYPAGEIIKAVLLTE